MKNWIWPVMAWATLCLLVASCTQKQAIFSGEAKPADFNLSFQEPEVFDFEIKAPGLHDFALAVTYSPELIQQAQDIPIYFIHEAPGMVEAEGKFKIPVKDETGEWLGVMQGNGHEKLVEHTFAQAIALSTGKHQVRIYGDNAYPGEPTRGIVNLTFKVLK